MKCRTCARRLDLERLDYTVGCKHEQMEGFICLACAFEGVAYWMTNISEDDYCEEYVPQRTPNAFPTHECVKATHECVEPVGISDNIEEMLQRFAQIMRNLEDMKILLSQRTGHWIHDTQYGVNLPEHKCSECGTWEYSDEESNFCPHCGSFNRGDKNVNE